MIGALSLNHILFLDIETVPELEHYEDLDFETQLLFESKTEYQRKDSYSASEFYKRAGIWAEFGKIICISVGYFVLNKAARQFRITSFYGEEVQLLKDFSALLHQHFSQPTFVLCGHNAKEFDYPFIARRLLINGLPIPDKLNLFGKKPWEVPHLDTLELWKFGDFKHYTSLRLLAKVLGIESPKDDIDGSQVAEVYYVQNNLERIVSYCEKDVIAVAQVILRFKGLSLLSKEEIYTV